MNVTPQELQKMFELFNDDPAALVGQFAPNAVYNQMNTGHVATGLDQISQVMAGWGTFFADAKIGDFEIDLMDMHEVRKQSGATQGFTVAFLGRGRYVHTIPGLESLAPAKGQDVTVPFLETVWLNDRRQIVRVDNSMDVEALR